MRGRAVQMLLPKRAGPEYHDDVNRCLYIAFTLAIGNDDFRYYCACQSV